NLLLFPTSGGDAPTLKAYLNMASAYGIRLVARGTPPQAITTGFLGVTSTSPEWAAFGGSFWGDGDSGNAHYSPAAAGPDVAKLHASAPDKFVMTYTNNVNIIQQWFLASPAAQRMDAWSQQGQILANSLYAPYHSTALDQWIFNTQTGFRPNWPSAYAM